jgi:predicted O-methyltransferase YrrM
MLPASFRGTKYRLANNWFRMIPAASKPIRYAEIGAFYGANLLSVASTYGAHPESVLIAIDPWTDYSEYPEYKGQQETIYETFQSNIQSSGFADKIVVKRGFSYDVLQTLEDNSFDMIYVDGNHESEFILEDGVLAFRKLKVGGYLIFDDYGWGGEMTTKPIDSFVKVYSKRIRYIGMEDSQVFIQKTR